MCLDSFASAQPFFFFASKGLATSTREFTFDCWDTLARRYVADITRMGALLVAVDAECAEGLVTDPKLIIMCKRLDVPSSDGNFAL